MAPFHSNPSRLSENLVAGSQIELGVDLVDVLQAVIEKAAELKEMAERGGCEAFGREYLVFGRCLKVGRQVTGSIKRHRVRVVKNLVLRYTTKV